MEKSIDGVVIKNLRVIPDERESLMACGTRIRKQQSILFSSFTGNPDLFHAGTRVFIAYMPNFLP
jgi:hypothetical protein